MKIATRWLFLALILTRNAQAVELEPPNQRFQLRHEVGELPAVESYNKTILEHKRRSSIPAEDCRFLGERYRCLTGGYILPPFPVIPLNQLLDRGYAFRSGWAPQTEVLGGAGTAAEWKKLAQTGAIFDCQESLCKKIVPILLPREEKEGEHIIAVCFVYRIGTLVGSPESCVPIAIFTLKNTWLKVAIQAQTLAFLRGRPDFHLRMIGKPLPALNAVLLTVQTRMASPPLELATEVLTSAIIGVASYRVSRILAGWRELTTVRVDASRDSLPPDEVIGLTISTTLYINRQNTDRPSDWHLPSQQQGETYVDTVRAQVRNALGSLCKSPAWKDINTLYCNKPLFTPASPK